jgi:DNA mismatch repair protein MutS
MTLFETTDHPLLETIRGVDLNDTTPLEALQLIQEWQGQLADEGAVTRPR